MTVREAERVLGLAIRTSWMTFHLASRRGGPGLALCRKNNANVVDGTPYRGHRQEMMIYQQVKFARAAQDPGRCRRTVVDRSPSCILRMFGQTRSRSRRLLIAAGADIDARVRPR